MQDITEPVSGKSADDFAVAQINAARARAIDDWQNRILPFVKWGIVALAVLVFGSVTIGGWRILNTIDGGSPATEHYATAVSEALKDKQANTNTATLGIVAYQAAHQHDRAGAALLTRELLRFCGFLIGAALSFVGAIFIMGKFSDVQPITASVEKADLKGTLNTSSPGIFAVAVGAALVTVSIFAHYEIGVTDAQLQLVVPTNSAKTASVAPPPPPSTAAGKEQLAALCKMFPENDQCR